MQPSRPTRIKHRRSSRQRRKSAAATPIPITGHPSSWWASTCNEKLHWGDHPRYDLPIGLLVDISPYSVRLQKGSDKTPKKMSWAYIERLLRGPLCSETENLAPRQATRRTGVIGIL